MTLHSAYSRLKKSHTDCNLAGCMDFGDSWGFYFVPKQYRPEEYLGGIYDTVNKITGEISYLSPIDNFELFDSGITIPVEQVISQPYKVNKLVPA